MTWPRPTTFLSTLLKTSVRLSFSNKITCDGVKFLGEVLKRNQTLEILDLHTNRIEDAGAIYLSEALALHNRTLRALVFTQPPRGCGCNNSESKKLLNWHQSWMLWCLSRQKSQEVLNFLVHFYFSGGEPWVAACVGFLCLTLADTLNSFHLLCLALPFFHLVSTPVWPTILLLFQGFRGSSVL